MPLPKRNLRIASVWLVAAICYSTAAWRWLWLRRLQIQAFTPSVDQFEKWASPGVNWLISAWNGLAWQHDWVLWVALCLLCLIPAICFELTFEPGEPWDLILFPVLTVGMLGAPFFLLPSGDPDPYRYFPQLELPTNNPTFQKLKGGYWSSLRSWQFEIPTRYDYESDDVKALFAWEMQKFLDDEGQYFDRGKYFLVPRQRRFSYAMAWWKWHSEGFRRAAAWDQFRWLREAIADADKHYFDASDQKPEKAFREKETECIAAGECGKS